MISSQIHTLFRNVLLISKYLRISQSVSQISFWFNYVVTREHTLCDFSPLKQCIEICFMAMNLIHLGEYTLKNCTVIIGWRVQCILVRSSGLIALVRSSKTWFSVHLFYWLLREMLESPNLVMDLSISPFWFIIFLMCFEVP